MLKKSMFSEHVENTICSRNVIRTQNICSPICSRNIPRFQYISVSNGFEKWYTFHVPGMCSEHKSNSSKLFHKEFRIKSYARNTPRIFHKVSVSNHFSKMTETKIPFVYPDRHRNLPSPHPMGCRYHIPFPINQRIRAGKSSRWWSMYPFCHCR